MNSRQINILKILKTSNLPVTLNELAQRFNVSVRTIQNDMKNINYEFLKNDLPPILNQYKKGMVFQYSNKEKNKIESLILKRDSQLLLPEERADLLYFYFLFNTEYTTISEISENLNVSRNTILNDLKKIRESLTGIPVYLNSNSRYGIILEGDEIAIREYAVKTFLKNSDAESLADVKKYHRASICNYYEERKTLEETKLIFELVQGLAVSLKKYFSGNSFLMIISCIELAIERIKRNKFVLVSSVQMESICCTEEFRAMNHLMKTISMSLSINIPITEIVYLTFRLFCSDVVNTKCLSINDNYAEIQIAVCGFIQKVSDLLELDLSHDTALYHDLVYHMQPAIYRMKYNIHQKNPLIDEIHTKYQHVYDAVAKSVSDIEDMTDTVLTENEIGYLTIHIIAMIEKQRNRSESVPNVLIVCESGIGTSNLLATRLTTLFDVNVVDTIALYELENALRNYNVNYIVTTLNLQNTDKLTIKVNPFINENDQKKLEKYFRPQSRKHVIDVQDFLEIIGDHCDIRDQENLLKSISEKYSISFNLKTRKEKELMLKDVINKAMIEIDYHAMDWEDSVRKAGELLLKGNCIEQEYIESMVNTVKSMGSYIVISKGIALPHSRSGEYSHKVGISILRLAEPVVFGHEENDPVDLLFGLSSIDNKSHLGALRDLSSLLTNEESIAFMRNVTSVDELYDYIMQVGGDSR